MLVVAVIAFTASAYLTGKADNPSAIAIVRGTAICFFVGGIAARWVRTRIHFAAVATAFLGAITIQYASYLLGVAKAQGSGAGMAYFLLAISIVMFGSTVWRLRRP